MVFSKNFLPKFVAKRLNDLISGTVSLKDFHI